MGAIFRMTNDLAQNVGGAVPPQQYGTEFGSALIDLLKKYQQLGRQREAAGTQEQYRRIFQTPENLIGAHPSLQEGVRNADVAAVQPTIGGARALVQEAGSAIESAQRLILLQQQQQQEWRNNAAQIVQQAIGEGSEAVQALLVNQPELIKLSGYHPETLKGVIVSLKRKEAPKLGETSDREKIELADGTILLVDKKTGKEIARYQGGKKGTQTTDSFMKDERFQQFQISNAAYSRISELAPDRSDETIKRIAKSEPSLLNLAKLLARLTSPDIARQAAADDPYATTKLTDLTRQFYSSWFFGRRVLPQQIKNALEEADRLYISAQKLLIAARKDYGISDEEFSNLVSSPIPPDSTTGGGIFPSASAAEWVNTNKGTEYKVK